MYQKQDLLKLFYYTVIQSITVNRKHLKYYLVFLPNKQFAQLVIISPHLLTMLKTTSAEFQSIELWFTDQNNRSLEVEHGVNIMTIIGQTL